MEMEGKGPLPSLRLSKVVSRCGKPKIGVISFNSTIKIKGNTPLSLTNLLEGHLGSSRCKMHRFWRKVGTIDEIFQRLEEEK